MVRNSASLVYAACVHEYGDILRGVLAGIIPVEAVGVFSKLAMDLNHGLHCKVRYLVSGGNRNGYRKAAGFV